MKVVAKPIDMIAFFKEDGIIEPIRFRMKEDEQEVIKIDRIQCRREEKVAGIRVKVFTCCSIINGIEKLFEIKYYVDNCKWILFKI